MSYKEVFPDYDAQFFLIDGFEDRSDARCTCPMIMRDVSEESAVLVFENYLSGDLRSENCTSGSLLYSVFEKGPDDEDPVLVVETDEWPVAERAALDAVADLESLF